MPSTVGSNRMALSMFRPKIIISLSFDIGQNTCIGVTIHSTQERITRKEVMPEQTRILIVVFVL
jgi:hypothetical protein